MKHQQILDVPAIWHQIMFSNDILRQLAKFPFWKEQFWHVKKRKLKSVKLVKVVVKLVFENWSIWFFRSTHLHLNKTEFFYFQYSELYLRHTTHTLHIPHQYLGKTLWFANCSAYIRVVYCLCTIKHYAFTHFVFPNFEKWKFPKLNLSYTISFSKKKNSATKVA